MKISSCPKFIAGGFLNHPRRFAIPPAKGISTNPLLHLLCLLLLAFPADASDKKGQRQASKAGPDAAEILERADRIRFPAEGFQVNVRVTSTAPGKDPEVKQYRILSKGNDRTLLMTTAPASERGQVMLMKDNDLWVFLPTVSQPVRLPLAQRLTGQVANGDLARANFTGDYTPKLLRTETIDGQDYHVLELTAAKRGTTYNRVLYWVNRDNFRPYQAEFFTLSGRRIKTASYQDFREMAGMLRPVKLLLEDASKEGHESVLDYSEMKLRELSDKVFTKQYLKKLNP